MHLPPQDWKRLLSDKSVYIAGKMRGMPDLNFPAFDRAAAALRGVGYTVFSPAERDRETGITASATPQQLRDAIMWDLQKVSEVDIVLFLSGWETSLGARAEHALAVFLGKDIRYE